MGFQTPTGRLYEHIIPETGEVIGVVDKTYRRVRKFTTPDKLYKKSRASNAVGQFYEHYVAYLLGAERVCGSGERVPDVQLKNPWEIESTLLFEVKGGHANNAAILKRWQLESFAQISNLFYIFIFHRIPNIQSAWDASERSKWRVRKALEKEYSSLFILPPQLLLAYFLENLHRVHNMPHYANGETYIEVSEAQVRRLFNDYGGPVRKSAHERIHVLSDHLALDSSRTYPSPIIRI